MSPSTIPDPVLQYPVNLELAGKRCLVVGGGNVAIRKIRGLVAAGARVTVVAPDVQPAIRSLATELDRTHNRARITILERRYWKHDLDGVRLVITCTDDATVNHQVHIDAEAANVWSNSADDPVNCAFTLPSVARQGDLQLTASTRGRSPALSMWLRRRFEADFDARWSELLDLLAEVRAEVRATRGTSEVSGWLEALDDGVVALVLSGDVAEARALLRRHLGLATEVASVTSAPPLLPVGAFESIESIAVPAADAALVDAR